MGRLVIADGQSNEVIEKLYVTEKWKIGLIIGQQTIQKDIVVNLIETPFEDIKKDEAINCINDVNDVYMKSHALQILRMLPGGLNIIGIFTYAPSQMFSISQAKIKQLLLATHKAVQKSNEISGIINPVQEKIVLQICSKSRILTCKSYDVHDSKTGPNPADWKPAHSPENWTELHSSLFLDLNFYIPSDLNTTSMYKHFLVGVKPFCQYILQAECSIDQKLILNDSEPLLEITKQTSNKKGKKQIAEAKEKVKKYVDLLFPFPSYSQSEKSCEYDCTAKMHLYGMIVSKAFVHCKATLSEVKAAVKEDLIRSILTRIKLLSEEIEQTEECEDRKILYELPKRCFAPSESNGVQFCDYMFPDESVTDSLDRFNEMFYLQLNAEDIEESLENFPDEDDLSRAMEFEDTTSEKTEITNYSTRMKNIGTAISVAASGVVALIAFGLSYVYLE